MREMPRDGQRRVGVERSHSEKTKCGGKKARDDTELSSRVWKVKAGLNRVMMVVESNTWRCESVDRSEKMEEKRKERVESPTRCKIKTE